MIEMAQVEKVAYFARMKETSWDNRDSFWGPFQVEEMQNPIIPNGPEFYKELLDRVGDGVYFVDRERRIVYWNEGATRLTGFTAEEILGKRCQDNILCHVDSSGKNLCEDGCPLSESIEDGTPHAAQIFLRHKQGRRVPVSVQVQPMRGADGSIIGAIEIFGENSAEMETQRKMDAMIRLAFLDHLTLLPNRRFLEMSLQTALSEYEVHHDPFGVLMIDLDKFKTINDTHGHAGGDRVLQEAARTLIGSLRPSDIVGRWGGDEFLAITRNVNLEVLRELAQRCAALIAQTAALSNDGRRIGLTSAVGAALSRPGETAEELVNRADALMYLSKTGGRGRATTE
jgi:diguanylate cyclase (GGDEF)-like protein/PAS domain S-box-containing protein